MNIKNKILIEKIIKELIIVSEEKENRNSYGTLTLNLRYLKGSITKDIDITYKESFKLE